MAPFIPFYLQQGSQKKVQPLLLRKYPDEVGLEHPGSRLGVSNSLEGDGGVVAEVVGHHLLPAWVEPEQVGDVVDAVEEHHPTVLQTTVVSHLVKADQAESCLWVSFKDFRIHFEIFDALR